MLNPPWCQTVTQSGRPSAQRLLQPLLSQAQEILARQLYATDTQERPVFSDLLRHHLLVIASVAKGV